MKIPSIVVCPRLLQCQQHALMLIQFRSYNECHDDDNNNNNNNHLYYHSRWAKQFTSEGEFLTAIFESQWDSNNWIDIDDFWTLDFFKNCKKKCETPTGDMIARSVIVEILMLTMDVAARTFHGKSFQFAGLMRVNTCSVLLCTLIRVRSMAMMVKVSVKIENRAGEKTTDQNSFKKYATWKMKKITKS